MNLGIKTDITITGTSVLLAGGDTKGIESLRCNLVKTGYNIITAHDGRDTLEKLWLKPDLVIIDAAIPLIDGFEVCRKMRGANEFRNIPVIILTDKYSEMDEVRAFNMGANDFILKPVSVNKISARIRSNLRKMNRSYETNRFSHDLVAGPLTINREKYNVSLDGARLIFPKKEFELLYFLASNPGRVFNRRALLENIWDSNISVMERTVDVHLLNIRRKLGEYSFLIETIKGVGYRFNDKHD